MKFITQVYILFMVLIGCKDHNSKVGEIKSELETGKIEKVTVSITENSFEAPENVPAGYVDIELVNQTNELHSAHLIKLEDGYSTKQLIKAYVDSSRTGGARPSWMIHRGGVISENGKANVTLLLEPGNYTWVCVMGSDTEPHFAGIEHKGVVVSGRVDDQIELPKPDVTIVMTDENHQLNSKIKSGSQAIDVVNSGSKYHLAAISKLNPDATQKDVINWFSTFAGPPPAKGVGVTSAIGPGLSARLNLNFEPGTYVLYCMANAEGTYHILEEAISTFTVE